MWTRARLCLALSGPLLAGCGSYVDDFPAQGQMAAAPGPVRLDVTDVTVDAYRACVSAGACNEPVTGGACNWNVEGRGNHPVNCVDWHQANAYCAFAGERLPTEEEWDLAARGAERRDFPWGNTPPTNAQLCWAQNSGGHTCAVGSFPAGDTPEGLKDMAGNVWEWTLSTYKQGGESRVVRGGSWDNNHAAFVLSSYRGRYVPSYEDADLGFRCARPI
jgi:formylglycine-generating enzyme required for sulfatase activity